MKYLLIIFAAFCMSGCGLLQRTYTHYTGSLTTKCSSVGTTIVQSDSGIAMLLDKDGKTVPCN